MKPFLYWAGTKTWLASTLDVLTLRRPLMDGYCEPFLGSGAAMMHLLGRKQLFSPVVLGDASKFVYMVWSQLLLDPVRFVEELLRIHTVAGQIGHEKAYYNMRTALNREEIEYPGPTMVWLNLHGWKGLLRVNSHDQINTPFGHHADVCVGQPGLTGRGLTHERLAALYWAGIRLRQLNATIVLGDFRKTISIMKTQGGSQGFLMADPPYMGCHDQYTAVPFTGFRNELAEEAAEWQGPLLLTDSVNARPVYQRVKNMCNQCIDFALSRPGGMSDGQGRGRAKGLKELVLVRGLPGLSGM